MLLVVPDRGRIAAAVRAVLAHDRVRAWTLPPLWTLAWDGVDAVRDLPAIRHVDLETVGPVVSYLLAASTPEGLERHVAREWERAGNRVREFFLRRSALAVFSSILRMGTPSAEVAPPPLFRSDAIHVAKFEAAYRLHVVPGAVARAEAPPEEASLVFYPFDPENAEGRAEAGLDPKGREAALEVFAYDAGRTRHREHLQAVAREQGWRVVDPSHA
jgi:hypothetical protein